MIAIIVLVVLGLLAAGLVYIYRPNRMILGGGLAALSALLAVWIYLKFLASD